MARWELTVGDQSRYSLIATLDVERQIAPLGDIYMPSVLLQFGWEEILDNGMRRDVWDRVMAVAVILHPPGVPFQYWVRTGLMPITRAAQPILPLSHALIEELSRAAQARREGEVVLDISIQVLASVQGSPATLNIHWHQQPQPVTINAPKWQTMLKQWGYPGMRLVPLYTELPQGIGGSNAAARTAWSAACSHLRTAHEQWIAGHTGDAGDELRHVVQLALRTWSTIWYPDNPPGAGEEWVETARRLGQGIPGCDVEKWTIRREAPTDAKRAFAILTLLRNLNTIANPFHHVGSAPVYTRADTDMLLTATTAIMRGLPEFWQQFPAPIPATPSGVPQTAT